MPNVNCPYVMNGIHFYVDNIRVCSSNAKGLYIKQNYNGEDIDWKEVAQIRTEFQKKLLSGDIPESCKRCFEIESFNSNYTPSSTEQINAIYISHWLHCNSSCVYCVHKNETNGEQNYRVKKSKHYDLLPILKKMLKEDLISKYARVIATGGEPTVLKEFDKIMDLFLKNTEARITVLTSGIRFNKKIEKALKLKRAEVVISIDSGCKETYEKIKRVNRFCDVKKNVEKYIKASGNAKDSFILKYILVKDMNDNIDEIEKWLSLAAKVKAPAIRLDIDYGNDLYENNSPVPKKYYDIFKYVIERSKELDLNLVSYGQIDKILELGYVI